MGERTITARLTALAAVLCAAILLSGQPALGQASKQRDRLLGEEFVNLKPFILPLLTDGDVTDNFIVVVAVEISDTDDRIKVQRVLPRLRDKIYLEMLRIVTFRRRRAKLPTVDDIKTRLNIIAKQVVGDDVIRALLVLQAFRRRPR